jgi:hypothetical protein
MRLSPLEAYDAVMRFARDCGELPLRLAMHASVAQSFRPLFLHLTKLNYLPEAAEDPSVESDVLLAPFCREIGAGYFDFDPRVRTLLLDNLQSEYAAEGRSRLRNVAGFLIGYLDAQERSIDSTQDCLSQGYIEVQRWIALSILDPDAAAQQLAAALNRTGRTGAAVARVQIGGLVNVLAAPLLRYPQLTEYALGVQALERGEVERAQDLLSGLGDLQVGPVKLRPARAVLAAWNVPEKTTQAVPKPLARQSEYASCFIAWGHGDHSRQFVHHLVRDLRNEGVDCHVAGEDFATDLSPLAGRQVLVLVNSGSESTWVLSQLDEAAIAGNPIVTLSLDPPWQTYFPRVTDAVGNVDFSEGRTADEPGYMYALHQLLDLLRDHAGWKPKPTPPPQARNKFKNDVFISYSNEEWARSFHIDLQSRLDMIRGVKTVIYREGISIVSGELWLDQMRENVRDSATFVAVVTRQYVQSEACREELAEFVAPLMKEGLETQGRRLFPVFLGPIKGPGLPYPLAEVQGITFPDPDGFDPKQNYWERIDELARAIKGTLDLLQPAQSKAVEKSVYLAYAAADVESVGDEVRRELESRGFLVRSPVYAEIMSGLERSSLSIHLIGAEYNRDAVAEFEKVQNSANREMPILVWIRPGAVDDPRQMEWIERIESGNYPAEVLRTSVEELKSYILDRLSRPELAPSPASGKSIYLQVDRSDLEAASPLARYLRDLGFSVVLPVFEGNALEARTYDEEALSTCQATILYWGSMPELWVISRHAATLKHALARPERPLMGLYLGPPRNVFKENFTGLAGFLLLHSLDEVNPSALGPVIDQLRPGANA